MIDRSEILHYIIKNYYGSIERMSEISGYSKNQISNWLEGNRKPQKQTIEYLIHRAVVPEFKVITEFAKIEHGKTHRTQFKDFLGEHANNPGLYAFYDSLGNLLYIGKATKLLPEMISAINRKVHIDFPKGVKVKPSVRTEIVQYVSAYDVGSTKWSDLPKHVESLILRISKPCLNKNIGYLARAINQPKES